MTKLIKALAISRLALKLLEEEIVRHKSGNGTIGTLSQLMGCKSQLSGMIKQLENSDLPPAELRLRGMGHMISDEWPLRSELGEALLMAEQNYLKV